MRCFGRYNFSSGCEVADMLVERLAFGPGVREALRFTFERWNGNGYPAHAQGDAIPLPMRVVHRSHDMEAIGRLFSPDHALEAARDRRDRTYDPALADLFVAHGRGWLDQLTRAEFDRVELHPIRPQALVGACVLQATEIYVGLTTERADRPPFSPGDAAAELRRLDSQHIYGKIGVSTRAAAALWAMQHTVVR